MDPISQARLDALRVMDMNTFTEDDAAFVRARSSYLTSDELVKFEAILRGVAVAEAAASEPAETQTEEKPAPKAKK